MSRYVSFVTCINIAADSQLEVSEIVPPPHDTLAPPSRYNFWKYKYPYPRLNRFSTSAPSTTPPSPVTWRAERTWNVDPYKLDDEEVDILGALLPVVAEEPKRRNLLNPGPSPSSSLRRSPSPSASAYSFPTTQHQLRHQQSISNRSHSSSTRTLPNPYPSPIKPLPPLPPRSSSSSTSSTSLEYLRRRESDPLSAGSTSSLNAGMGRGGNEGTRSEVVGLETTLRRMHVTSDALLEGGKLRKEVGARNEGESRRSEKLSEATGERASESTWSRVERGVKSADRRRREEGIEMNVEEVLKSDSVNEEDEDEFSLPFLPPRHPILAPPPIPLSTRPCRSALPFSQSSSSLLLPPPVSPPPLIPLPPVPNSPILGDNHSRRSSATTEESTRETISTAPTSPLPAVKPSVYSPPNPSGYRSG